MTTSQLLLIDGSASSSSDGGTYEVSSPWDADLASVAAAATEADVDRAVDAASRAFAAWSRTSAEDRARILRRAGELLEERASAITAIMTSEVGATFGWGMFNCSFAAHILKAAADLPAQVQVDEIESAVPGLAAQAVRQPLGVVAGIAPWNAPVILGARAIAAPLALGNTVVFKASEECPRTHGAIVQALIDAGVPDGAVNLITNRHSDGPTVVERIIDHPSVRHVNFTGSSEVGRIIAVRAAGLLKRTLLELGGKAPFIVCADADLEQAASAASFGAFMNSGQICMSTERILVHRDVAEEFTAMLAARVDTLTSGDPTDPSVTVGPVVAPRASERIGALIDDATTLGAEVVRGGGVGGNLVQPTVLAGVTPDMRLYAEESFGPVVTITEFDDEDEAIRLANDSDFGLSAAVFSRDVARARDLAGRIQSGNCHVNGATVHDEPQMPFGGVKDSGWGRFGGPYAIQEFTDLRWITIQEGERHYPI